MKESLSIRFLYGTKIGRCFLKILTDPAVSKAAGKLLSTELSALAVPFFVKKHKIDMRSYERPVNAYHSFNDFFTRKRPGAGIRANEEEFASPCDAFLTAYRIADNGTYRVKHVEYHLDQLLRRRGAEKKYAGGYCLIFRLTPQHYHRYVYAASGTVTTRKHIEGILHCVRPAALDVYPVFAENTREFTLTRSERWGDVVQMEVGAMMVGKICNLPCDDQVVRGQEKGFFEFGGSTIIVLLEKDRIVLKDKILKNSALDVETSVKMGTVIGSSTIR